MNRPKRIQPGERIRVRLTERERQLIVKHTFIGGDLERRIRIATVEGSVAVVGLTLDDLDELIGCVAAEANHSKNERIGRQLDRLWNCLRAIEDRHTDEDLAVLSDATTAPATPGYTTKQGQYLAFIHYYTKIHGEPPSESEMQRYFKVSPPAVHQMILTLEARGFIERLPGKARSIRILAPSEELPDLE
jgi:repressor LexA